MVGMHGAHLHPELRGHLARVGVAVPGGKPSTSSAHARGSARVVRVVEFVPARWAISGRADRPAPAHRLVQHRRDEVADRHVQAFDGVDRAEHLGEPGSGRVEVEADLLAVAEQAVGRQGEAVAIDLEAMAQAGLDDALVPVDLVDQPVDVGDEVLRDVTDVAGDDGAEQQAAEARRRVDGQHEVAEGDPPRRGQRPGVPHLELGEEHPVNLSEGFRPGWGGGKPRRAETLG